MRRIEAPASGVTTERVWCEPGAAIDIRYRNISELHFRLVPFEFDEFVSGDRRRATGLNRGDRRELLDREPVRRWSESLPATPDYQERVESIAAPLDVAAGSYFLIASQDRAFDESDNQISFAEVWVSRLALVTRGGSGAGGLVLDAVTGEPHFGAEVKAWRWDRRNGYRELSTVRTDAEGRFSFPSSDRQRLVLLARHEGQSLSSSGQLFVRGPVEPRRVQTLTRLFTDRALYRPGQTIRYKGICVRADREGNDYETISGRDVDVVFLDVNGKEIQRVTHRTGDYGSFSGSVTAPRDRLPGRMTLRVGNPAGQVAVSVEEYKRPKFKVELEPPDSAAKLGETVELGGKAVAYTGAPIDGAQVRWRVVREVRFPPWWRWLSWRYPPQPGQRQEIAHGTTTTSAGGRFELEFVARPDESVARDAEPTFRFTVHADVIDSTGETRSDERSVNVGYTALQASLSTGSWTTERDPITISVRTESLDGESRSADGTVQIHALDQPEEVVRPELGNRPRPMPRPGSRGDAAMQAESGDPNSWPLGEVVHEFDFETDAAGNDTLNAELDAGIYRAVLTTHDRYGNEVTAMLPLEVIDPGATSTPITLPELFKVKDDAPEPGDEFVAVWATGYDSARALVEVEHRGEVIQSFWTDPQVTQVEVRVPVTEVMRGGFTVRTTMVRENRAHLRTRSIDVPWTNKQLQVTWERFVSKLKPAAEETWTATIRGHRAEARAAEMVATLYDASLDAFAKHDWPSGFHVFRQNRSYVASEFQNVAQALSVIVRDREVSRREVTLSYPRLPRRILAGRIEGGRAPRYRLGQPRAMAAGASQSGDAMMAGRAADGSEAAAAPPGEGEADPGPRPELDDVSARKDLAETAFFYPHLTADDDGSVKIEFTMPETLTEWRFLGFAHDSDLRGGLLTDSAVTAKDLMVQPNPPRFVREGDEIEFTVKVTNQSPARQTGSVRLTFSDARTGASVDERLGIDRTDRRFDIPSGESASVAWRLAVPDGLGFLTYRAVGSSGRLSDGEEGYLPVLSRRILVTETLPLPIRGKQTKEFDFERLEASVDSETIEHQSYTLQMVSNPSWYAVLALPYLMEYPHQCSEQIFNRYYANALARHIANSDPKIERTFERWRATEALESPLEKNEELKSVLIEETPWYRQARSESQSRRNVGVLFERNRLDRELSRALFQLTEMQLPDGRWPWFPGGRANDFITLYITTGFGRLRHLGADVDVGAAIKSLDRLDAWVAERYRTIDEPKRGKHHLTSTIALYLYGRSFFLGDRPIPDEHRGAVDYWLDQAKEHWVKLGVRQSQAQLAIALKRFGDPETARDIMASLKERAVTDEELGMYWPDAEFSWWWYRAPIETQAVIIEALDEVSGDRQAVRDCQVWLLKQKQIQNWRTTKATADAVYALLLRGENRLASDAVVKVEVGGERLKPGDVEPGTGFFEKRWSGSEVRPELSHITVTKADDGVSWGGAYWQYFQDIGEVTADDLTPLKLEKRLYVKKNSDEGPTLHAVDGPVSVGDELVVRLTLRVDRDMEYVHLKDHRGSGTEPLNVLSQYRFQDGLAYYQSTRDTASHFFIDYLPRGTYVFEYSTHVQLEGEYQTGVASIQCMYAPEFNSHSESLAITVE